MVGYRGQEILSSCGSRLARYGCSTSTGSDSPGEDDLGTDITAMTLRPRKPKIIGSGTNSIPIGAQRKRPLAATPSDPVSGGQAPEKYSPVNKDSSDWKLNPDVFEKINRRWGQHTVDMFSSPNNGQMRRRYGIHAPDRSAAGIDAFKQDCPGNGWLTPVHGSNYQGLSIKFCTMRQL